MIINHPLLGPRDAAEFVYLGDASLIDRPDPLQMTLLKLFTNTDICATTQQANIKSCGITNKGIALGLL